MSNFHMTELEVIRYAEACGVLNKHPEQQALRIVSSVGCLCNSIVDGGKVHVTEDMGRVAIDMIVLCAMLDIDLAKSLETAFNKISAKPVDPLAGGKLFSYVPGDATPKSYLEASKTQLENPAALTTQGTVTEVTFPPPSEANIAAMEKLLGNVVLLKRE